ncbi:MAG: type I restriction enzyme HsdR N-terminal domain-containing protein [Parasphingorhabdus sp.]|uniref:type I restriction enzyme HsdR N-terminal domain-containing protein n=1 Tax=Parasphingorhabdus sp. TaxID=2709688 RepID=UPI00329887D3
MAIPKRIQNRLVKGLKTYQPIVKKLRSRDVSEADTVTVIKDIFADIFGFEKYTELTSEQQIRGTFCDLAVKVESKIHYLIEVKAAGVNLNSKHLKQAVNYGMHEGIEWVILTNGIEWKIYKLRFVKPVEYTEVMSFSFCDLNPKSQDDLSQLHILCRESITTDALAEYHKQAQIVNRFVVAELIQSDEVLRTVRRSMRRIFNNIKVSEEELRIVICDGVLKRDVQEGDDPKKAKAAVRKAMNSYARKQE